MNQAEVEGAQLSAREQQVRKPRGQSVCGMVRKLVWLIDHTNMESVGQGEEGLVGMPSVANVRGLYSVEPLRATEIIR